MYLVTRTDHLELDRQIDCKHLSTPLQDTDASKITPFAYIWMAVVSLTHHGTSPRVGALSPKQRTTRQCRRPRPWTYKHRRRARRAPAPPSRTRRSAASASGRPLRDPCAPAVDAPSAESGYLSEGGGVSVSAGRGAKRSEAKRSEAKPGRHGGSASNGLSLSPAEGIKCWAKQKRHATPHKLTCACAQAVERRPSDRDLGRSD